METLSSLDRAPLTSKPLKPSLLAAMSDFLDADAIVADGVSFASWVVAYHSET
jgi:hypothetical protein